MPSPKLKRPPASEQYQIKKGGKVRNVHISEIKAGDTYRFVLPEFASPWRTAAEDAWQQQMTNQWVVTPVTARKNKNHPLGNGFRGVK